MQKKGERCRADKPRGGAGPGWGGRAPSGGRGAAAEEGPGEKMGAIRAEEEVKGGPAGGAKERFRTVQQHELRPAQNEKQNPRKITAAANARTSARPSASRGAAEIGRSRRFGFGAKSEKRGRATGLSLIFLVFLVVLSFLRRPCPLRHRVRSGCVANPTLASPSRVRVRVLYPRPVSAWSFCPHQTECSRPLSLSVVQGHPTTIAVRARESSCRIGGGAIGSQQGVPLAVDRRHTANNQAPNLGREWARLTPEHRQRQRAACHLPLHILLPAAS
ncbi:hypothetical protein ANO11243_063590 [Dothideomycetidae sp. 11243]|nr:hypothetical protein ANO11243_063590 [fungal sp. No.11243]